MRNPSALYLYTEDLSEEKRKELNDLYVRHGWPPLESGELVTTIYVYDNDISTEGENNEQQSN